MADTYNTTGKDAIDRSKLITNTMMCRRILLGKVLSLGLTGCKGLQAAMSTSHEITFPGSVNALDFLREDLIAVLSTNVADGYPTKWVSVAEISSKKIAWTRNLSQKDRSSSVFSLARQNKIVAGIPADNNLTGGLAIYSAADGNTIQILDVTQSSEYIYSLICFALSPDMDLVYYCAGDLITCFDTRTGKQISSIHILNDENVAARSHLIQVTPNGLICVALISLNHLINVYDSKLSRIIGQFEGFAVANVSMGVNFCQNNLLIGGSILITENFTGHHNIKTPPHTYNDSLNGLLREYAIPSGKLERIFSGISSDVTFITSSTDCDLIVAATSNNEILMWLSDSGLFFRKIEYPSEIRGIKFSPDSKHICVASGKSIFFEKL